MPQVSISTAEMLIRIHKNNDEIHFEVWKEQGNTSLPSQEFIYRKNIILAG